MLSELSYEKDIEIEVVWYSCIDCGSDYIYPSNFNSKCVECDGKLISNSKSESKSISPS